MPHRKLKRGSARTMSKDAKGSVTIRVLLHGSSEMQGGFVKGNITRSMTIKNATVSEVFAKLEREWK